MICVYICMAYIFTWHIYIYAIYIPVGKGLENNLKTNPSTLKLQKALCEVFLKFLCFRFDLMDKGAV